jgi:saccharopine dehydrogenase (NAD+, L-lysine-forming)
MPAMIGALLFITGQWSKAGVFNTEEFDPDPFMEQLNIHRLPCHELHDVDLEL